MRRATPPRVLDHTKLEPRLPCFDSDEDWQRYCELQANLMRGRVTRVTAARAACDDCSISVQFIATLQDRCHPVAGAVTPRMRQIAGIEEEDEPWPEVAEA